MISASSAGFNGANYAKITLNGFQVQVEKNENEHYRGLHIVVFNPYNGLVDSAQVFDTYKTSTNLENFI